MPTTSFGGIYEVWKLVIFRDQSGEYFEKRRQGIKVKSWDAADKVKVKVAKLSVQWQSLPSTISIYIQLSKISLKICAIIHYRLRLQIFTDGDWVMWIAWAMSPVTCFNLFLREMLLWWLGAEPYWDILWQWNIWTITILSIHSSQSKGGPR